jgi:hypothetical protein
MPQNLDILELGEAGFGDHLKRLSGGIREQVEVERVAAHFGLWISMGKSLAQASGRLQAKGLSPPFRIDPQIRKG